MRLLVITNNALCYNNSNGKVMKNYLKDFSESDVFNFFINKSGSEGCIGNHYFCVEDKDALSSFLNFGRRKEKQKKKDESSVNGSNNEKKTSAKYIARFCVWNSGFWKTKEFKKWIASVNPTHVCLMLGNNPYLYKLSKQIAKKFGSKLVVFIGEDYPIKNYNYIEKTKHKSLSFGIFQSLTKRHFKSLLKRTNLVIFNSEYIKADYIKKYKIKNERVFYQLSDLTGFKPIINKPQNVLYAGNLGVGRIDALIVFAKTLYSFDSTIVVNVFGNANEEMKSKMLQVGNIVFHGFVSNEKITAEMQKSDVLIHVEQDSEYSVMNLKNAFSTKISDLICSNRRILLFAPRGLAETEYFVNNISKNVATSQKELSEKIPYIFGDDYDYSITEKMSSLHSVSHMSRKIKETILNL